MHEFPRKPKTPPLQAAASEYVKLDVGEHVLAAEARPHLLVEAAGPQGKDARRRGDFCPHFSPAPRTLDMAEDTPLDLPPFFLAAEQEEAP